MTEKTVDYNELVKDQKKRLAASKQGIQTEWFKQAFLISFLPQLTALPWSKAKISPFVKCIDTQEVSKFINLMTMNSSVMSILHATPLQFSQLIPQIRIFRAAPGETQKEFIFPAKTDWEAFKNPSAALKIATTFNGPDAGIKSVAVRMEGRGRNPFSANILDVTVKLFFQDIKTLFKNMGTKGDPISYSDLIRYTSSTPPFDYRIRMELGWSMSDSKNVIAQPEFKKAVQQTKTQIMCDLYAHKMDFKENGTVSLEVKYKGSLENVLSQQSADVLNSVRFTASNTATERAMKLAARKEKLDARKKRATMVGKAKKLKEKLKLAETLRKHGDAYAFNGHIPNGITEEAYTELLIEVQLDILSDLKKTGGERGSKHKGFEGRVPDKYNGRGLGGVSDGVIHDYEFGKIGHIAKDLWNLPIEKQRAALREKSLFDRVGALGQNSDQRKTLAKNLRISAGYEQLPEVLTSLKRQLAEIEENIKKSPTDDSIKKELDAQIVTKQNSQRASDIFTYFNDLIFEDLLYVMDTGIGSPYEQYANVYLGTYAALDGATSQESQDLLEKLKTESKTAKQKAPEYGEKVWNKIKINNSIDQARNDARTLALGGLYWGGGGGSFENQFLDSFRSRVFTEGPWTKEDKLYYFLLGDLVSAILGDAQIAGSLGTELSHVIDFSMIFGPMEYQPIAATNRMVANIYRIPINYTLFTEFLAQKIIAEGKKSYPLLQFIEDLIQFIMNKILANIGIPASAFVPQGGKSSAFENNFTLDITPVEIPSATLKKMKPVTKLPRNVSAGGAETKNLTPFNRAISSQFANAFVLHSKRFKPRSAAPSHLNGDLSQDTNAGIFHFIVGGPDRGILKSIAFSEEQNALFQVALYRKSQGEGEQTKEGVIAPSKFKIQLRLIGNPYFKIGQQVFVNTTLVDGGYLAQENLNYGGYYVIVGVDNYFGPDKWETTIDAVLDVPDRAVRRGMFKAHAVDPVQFCTKEEKQTLKKIEEETKKENLAGKPTVLPKSVKRGNLNNYNIEPVDWNKSGFSDLEDDGPKPPHWDNASDGSIDKPPGKTKTPKEEKFK